MAGRLTTLAVAIASGAVLALVPAAPASALSDSCGGNSKYPPGPPDVNMDARGRTPSARAHGWYTIVNPGAYVPITGEVTKNGCAIIGAEMVLYRRLIGRETTYHPVAVAFTNYQGHWTFIRYPRLDAVYAVIFYAQGPYAGIVGPQRLIVDVIGV